MIHILENETKQTSDLKKLFYDLKEYSKILNYEFLFKSFLFIDFFWNATIPNDIKEVLYGFTLNRNLYSNQINHEIFEILEEKYNEKIYNYNSKYYLMLKYTKGIIISYLSEGLTRKLGYIKEEIDNHDISVLFLNDLIVPHYNAINQYFMVKQNYTMREKKVHIFNNNKYMIDCCLDSTFQIGLNKNILIVCIIKLIEKTNKMYLLTNKNFKIISINENFYNKFNLSLALIEEFKIEIKDLFDIHRHNIAKKYKKEFEKIKEIRQYIQLDPQEYVLKNIFKQNKSKDNYKFNEDIFLNKDNENDNDQNNDDENKPLKQKVTNNFLNIVHRIYNNLNIESISIKTINFVINKETIINKIKKIMEKISLYEQGKLENKNLYKDYLKFNQNYNLIYLKNSILVNLKMKLKFLYETPFYLCQVEQYENNILIKDDFNFWDKKLSISIDNEKDVLSVIGKKSGKNLYEIKNKDPGNTEKEIRKENSSNKLKSEKEKIKTNKISKALLGFILVCLIFILLIIYIIILIYQMNLIKQSDIIFKTLFYTYYQKAQLLYINSVIISIQYNLVNLTDISAIKENKETSLSFGSNLEEGFHQFYKYYIDYKSGVGETVEELYKLKKVNKLTVNWLNQVIYNDYIKEMQLLLYRVFDIGKTEEFPQEVIDDCEYFLLGKFKNNPNNKYIEIYDNLIKYCIIF